MRRRELVGCAAAAMLHVPGIRIHGNESPWEPDGIGSVARLGVLTPDFDPVPESEMSAMAPRGISIHAARVFRRGAARSFVEPPQVDTATEQLASLKPQAVLFAFTSSSYAMGAEGDAAVRTRLETHTNGAPVLLTCAAAVEALRLLGSRRLALVHPPWFSEQANEQGIEYFRRQGFEVLMSSRISPQRTFQEVSPAEVFDWTSAHVPPSADAAFIGGNGLRAIGAIQRLERKLRRPVLTANQVLLWQALRRLGVAERVARYGRVYGFATRRG